MSDDPRWGDDRGTVETTTGATVTTKTRLRWGVVRVQPLRETTTPTMTRGIVTIIHEGSSATATHGIGMKDSTRATCSRD